MSQPSNAEMLADVMVAVGAVRDGQAVTHFFASQAAYVAAETFLFSLSATDTLELLLEEAG